MIFLIFIISKTNIDSITVDQKQFYFRVFLPKMFFTGGQVGSVPLSSPLAAPLHKS